MTDNDLGLDVVASCLAPITKAGRRCFSKASVCLARSFPCSHVLGSLPKGFSKASVCLARSFPYSHVLGSPSIRVGIRLEGRPRPAIGIGFSKDATQKSAVVICYCDLYWHIGISDSVDETFELQPMRSRSQRSLRLQVRTNIPRLESRRPQDTMLIELEETPKQRYTHGTRDPRRGDLTDTHSNVS